MLKQKEAAFLEVREPKVWPPVTLRSIVLSSTCCCLESVCVFSYFWYKAEKLCMGGRAHVSQNK